MAAPLEIERKWMVNGWPSEEFPLVVEMDMAQGYISTKPTVRIRCGKVTDCPEPDRIGQEKFILCIKSKSPDKGLSRMEVEMPIEQEKFDQLKELIGLPLISKVRRTYYLPDGNKLEVNHVDEGLPSEFWYAEVEFDSAEDATFWQPSKVGLADYLTNEVTRQKGQSMAAYWRSTRLNTNE